MTIGIFPTTVMQLIGIIFLFPQPANCFSDILIIKYESVCCDGNSLLQFFFQVHTRWFPYYDQ